ncbi:MAG: thioredoxin domain-containing protein [Anaerolineales bacterium]
MPNHLIHETSPYLLQHAHNPVEWFPWSQQALEKARREDKPIFLSIGYAACHWCHVMAHESFENPETAAFLNEHFVSIKVDREERPDLDSIYMNATVALTGSGGWPMSVFLTPDLQPFYAGTYFPPVRRYNMPSFREVLEALATAWKNEREKVLHSAGQIVAHIQQQPPVSRYQLALDPQRLDQAVENLRQTYDWGYGGWGSAPKFPQPMTIEFLLRRHCAGNPQALEPAVHALHSMARGGMYDVVGGGFARYSTDNFWRVPHFEKMLYDNAQLARAYLHAWQVTRQPAFYRVLTETLAFVGREMTHPEGGFYSSLDADSDGEEGKFYVWTREEIREQLSENSEFFEAAYGITGQGNWEGKTVLQRALDDATLAARFGLDPQTVPVKLAECHAKLLAARERRPRPATDDKILTAWNGLMLATLAEAARTMTPYNVSSQQTDYDNMATRNAESLLTTTPTAASSRSTLSLQQTYYNMATRNAEFLLTTLRPQGQLRRAWRDGKTSQQVFLDDYAALVLALLELYQTDFQERWYTSALELSEEMIARFSDPQGGFFDTPSDGESLFLRPKDLQDNATPSGGALACEALLTLATFTGNGHYRDLAEQTLASVAEAALRYPTAFARWLSAADVALGKTKQVAVLGEAGQDDFEALMRFLRAEYRPGTVVAASAFPPSPSAPALLKDRPLVDGRATVYVCENFVCRHPVTQVEQLAKIL